MTDVAVTGPDWEAMTHGHRASVLADYIAGFRRRSLEEFWIIGWGLEVHLRGMSHGDKGAYLDSIDMRPAMATELRRLARGYPDFAEIQQFATKDAALKALPAAHPKEDPKAAPTADGPEAVTGEVVSNAEAEAAMAEAVREHEEQRDHGAEREEEEERQAMQGEHVDPADERRKAAERHREDVAAVNESRRTANSERRKNGDVCDALLGIPRDADAATAQAAIDDVLERFWSVARK